MTSEEKIALAIAILSIVAFFIYKKINSGKREDYEKVIKDKLTEEEKQFIKEYKDEMKNSKA